jgi:LytTr DNA-binding domain
MINILIVGSDSDISLNIKSELTKFLYDDTKNHFIRSGLHHAGNNSRIQNDIVVIDRNSRPQWEIYKKGIHIAEDYETVYINDNGQFYLDEIKKDFLPALIKKIFSNDLKEALQTAMDRIAWKRSSGNTITWQKDGFNKKIIIKKDEGIEILSISDIMYIQAWGKYCLLFTKDGNKHLSPQNIGNIKSELTSVGYFQSHKSYLINVFYIKRIKHENLIELTNGINLPLARRRKMELIQQLSSKHPEINIMHIKKE